MHPCLPQANACLLSLLDAWARRLGKIAERLSRDVRDARTTIQRVRKKWSSRTDTSLKRCSRWISDSLLRLPLTEPAGPTFSLTSIDSGPGPFPIPIVSAEKTCTVLCDAAANCVWRIGRPNQPCQGRPRLSPFSSNLARRAVSARASTAAAR